MLTAEAHVPTERASRYLVQLCRHASQLGQHRPRLHVRDDTHAPPAVQHVEWSDTHGTVRLNRGQWTLEATQDTLTLRAEATSETELRRIQDLLAGRLEKIGGRDHLTVTWQRPDAPPGQPGDAEQSSDPSPTEMPQRGQNTTKGQRSLAARWSLVAVVVLFVAIHLGLGGAALAASSWTVWTALGLVAVLVLKIAGLRLLATRRRRPSQR
ncbi:DUF2218 domain-containing protein [Actinophytocola sp.]|uniref:DUF2218 domain-containing protein n=1 Tax=Actinophytocola sp. TaxID=1872138 RepID=UPI002EDAB0AC